MRQELERKNEKQQMAVKLPVYFEYNSADLPAVPPAWSSI